MILFTRVEARDFRTLYSHCVSGRPRGPEQPVVIAIWHGIARIASTTTDGVTLILTTPASDQRDAFLVLPASILAEVEGSDDGIVSLHRQSPDRGVIHWPGSGLGRTLQVELISPGQEHEIPAAPKFTLIAAKVLAALQECGLTSGVDSGLFALSRIQFQGSAGRIVATDGNAALLWSGFRFPFRDNLLVPALPVFGVPPLAQIRDVWIGRTPTHLVLAAGAWSVSLPIDTRSRFPDVASLIPRHAATIARIEGRDALELQMLWSALPGGDEENRAVTIDTSGGVKIRARDLTTLAVRELTLCRSQALGPSVRVALDRRLLMRSLTLGCHTLKLTPAKPIVAEGEDLILVAAPLDPGQIVPSTID